MPFVHAGISEGHMGKLLRDEACSRLLEVALAVAPDEMYMDFYSRCVLVVQSSRQSRRFTKPIAETVPSHAPPSRGTGPRRATQWCNNHPTLLYPIICTPIAACQPNVSSHPTPCPARSFLKGRLLGLACHHCANFVVQSALAAAASPDQVRSSRGWGEAHNALCPLPHSVSLAFASLS